MDKGGQKEQMGYSSPMRGSVWQKVKQPTTGFLTNVICGLST